MKRLVLITALTLAASGAALAQQATPAPDTQPPAPVTRHHAPNPSKETARMAKALNLTPDQTAKVEPILSDRDAQIAALNSNTAMAVEDRQVHAKAIRKAAISKLADMLTPGQMQQLKDMRKKHYDNHETENSPAV